MAKGLTDVAIRNLKPRAARWEKPDPGAHGLYVVINPSGKKGFVVRYRFAGKPCKLTLTSGITLAAARKLASDAMFAVSQGRDPASEKAAAKAEARTEVKPNTLAAVAGEYMKLEGGKLRTAAERQDYLDRLILPVLGSIRIDQIKRSQITRMLDEIEGSARKGFSGKRAADLALAILRKVMNWHVTRADDFASPVARGMGRYKAKPRPRILNDDELRAVWSATGDGAVFSQYVRFLLLTGCRRMEAADLRWSEIGQNNVWLLPADRNKTGEELLRPLSLAAQKILADRPRTSPYVFTADGSRGLCGFSRAKRRLDRVSGIVGWTLHDCRRTARTLMSRADVATDIAELALGHVKSGVRGIYDQYPYQPQLKAAFEALAKQIEEIVSPPPAGEVVPSEELDKRRAARR